jgi:outer membrane protein assembly factor BamB
VTGIDVASGIGALVTTGGALIAFNPATGHERWRVDLADPPVGDPQVTRTGVFLATATSAACYRLYRGHIRWQTALRPATGVALHAGALFVGVDDGHVIALDPETGQKRWTRPAGTRPLAGLLADGLHLVTVSTDGAMERLECDDGQPVDRRRLRGGPLSPPVVTGGRLIAVTAGGTVEALPWRVPSS